MNVRAARIAAFLDRAGYGGWTRARLAGDASARRYERLTGSDGRTAILVDTPFPKDDLLPFMAVGGLLAEAGFSVPEVFAADAGLGLAVQEDFGDDTFAACLDRGDDPAPLYALAVDVLAALRRRVPAERLAGLPLYDAANFRSQVGLFAEVHLPLALGRPLEAEERAGFDAAWSEVVDASCTGPECLLLRDYHVGNAMLLPRPGLRSAGLIDFQNAGCGPAAYDLVSLLEDARRDVGADLAAAMLERYRAAFPALDDAAFRRSYAVLGAVRHTRIVGIFTRVAAREKRRGYLVHVPRVWRLLEAKLALPELAPVARWFDRHVPETARAGFVVPEAIE